MRNGQQGHVSLQGLGRGGEGLSCGWAGRQETSGTILIPGREWDRTKQNQAKAICCISGAAAPPPPPSGRPCVLPSSRPGAGAGIDCTKTIALGSARAVAAGQWPRWGVLLLWLPTAASPTHGVPQRGRVWGAGEAGPRAPGSSVGHRSQGGEGPRHSVLWLPPPLPPPPTSFPGESPGGLRLEGRGWSEGEGNGDLEQPGQISSTSPSGVDPDPDMFFSMLAGLMLPVRA